MFRDDPAWAAPAARVSALAKDVTEFLTSIGLAAPSRATGQRVAYHSACSMQHGQRLREEPKALLAAAGFSVVDVPEGHLCCGSAGTYNLLQPALAEGLRTRKLANIAAVAPENVPTRHIRRLNPLAPAAATAVRPTRELLDRATRGGPPPASPRR